MWGYDVLYAQYDVVYGRNQELVASVQNLLERNEEEMRIMNTIMYTMLKNAELAKKLVSFWGGHSKAAVPSVL